MTRLVWDDLSSRNITAGVDRGVFYPPEGPGVAWSGLVSVETSVDSHETRSYFLNGQKVYQNSQTGDFKASITAYFYPDELDSSKNLGFGMSYRTLVKTEEQDYYQLHILYNVFATDKDLSRETTTTDPSLALFEWDLSSLPTNIDGLRAANHLVVDSRYAYPWLLTALESTLYGSDNLEPTLPDLMDLLDIFEEASILKITNHGDGTWTAEGPPVYMVGPTEFAIDWSSVAYLDSETYTVRSF